MIDLGDKKKLTRALARVVAWKKQAGKRRAEMLKHVSGKLDANVHAVGVANAAMQDGRDNPLVYRYLRTQLVEGARLRALEGRGQKADDDAAAE